MRITKYASIGIAALAGAALWSAQYFPAQRDNLELLVPSATFSTARLFSEPFDHPTLLEKILPGYSDSNPIKLNNEQINAVIADGRDIWFQFEGAKALRLGYYISESGTIFGSEAATFSNQDFKKQYLDFTIGIWEMSPVCSFFLERGDIAGSISRMGYFYHNKNQKPTLETPKEMFELVDRAKSHGFNVTPSYSCLD